MSLIYFGVGSRERKSSPKVGMSISVMLSIEVGEDMPNGRDNRKHPSNQSNYSPSLHKAFISGYYINHNTHKAFLGSQQILTSKSFLKIYCCVFQSYLHMNIIGSQHVLDCARLLELLRDPITCT